MKMLTRFKYGDAEFAEIDSLLELTQQIERQTICVSGDATAWHVQGLIKNFRHKIEDRIDE